MLKKFKNILSQMVVSFNDDESHGRIRKKSPTKQTKHGNSAGFWSIISTFTSPVTPLIHTYQIQHHPDIKLLEPKGFLFSLLGSPT